MADVPEPDIPAGSGEGVDFAKVELLTGLINMVTALALMTTRQIRYLTEKRNGS